MSYRRNDQADLNGSYLRIWLDNLHKAEMVETFRAPGPNAFFDPDNGYEGDEWYFESEDGAQVFSVYARWGAFRVGAPGNVSAYECDRFVEWLRGKLNPVKA